MGLSRENKNVKVNVSVISSNGINGGREMKSLVIDDDRNIRETMLEFLEMEGFEVDGAASLREAAEKINETDYHLAVIDHKLPDGEGLTLLKQIREKSPQTDIFMVTGWANIDLAVEAMRFGASDFLTKPIDMDNFLDRIRGWRREKSRIIRKKIVQFRNDTFEGVIGNNEKMRRAVYMFERAAPSDVAVLVRGETGTGKELVALALHRSSLRKDGPFINVNCAAIPDNLLESELFGYEKGAFTGAVSRKKGKFELAQGGTIFLDEIGDLSFSTQAQLLRVIQEKKIEPLGSEKSFDLDVRIVAATNKDLESMVEDGSYRQDLYYRLNVITIFLPTLMERREDIPEIVDFFIKRYNDEFGKNIASFAPGLMDYLKGHTWPGNIRELQNAISRAMIMSDGHKLTMADFNISTIQRKKNGNTEDLRKAVEMMEKDRLQDALAQTGGNQVKAAVILGMKRTTLRYKLQKYKLIAA